MNKNSHQTNYSQNENVFVAEKYDEFKDMLDALKITVVEKKGKKKTLGKLQRLNIRQIGIFNVA